MTTFKKTLSGFSWIAGLRVSLRLATFVRIAIVARILTTHQFGLFGIASIVLSLLEIFTETGINVYLIQQNDSLEKVVDTAWVISILRGLFMALVIFTLSPLVSGFFQAPESLFLLRLTAFVPLIRGFINPSIIRLQKDLKFNLEFFYRFTLLVIETTAIILISLITRSAASFVWGLIITAGVEVFLSFLVISPRPRLIFRPSQARHIFHHGKWITGFGILDYIYTTGDNIIVGRLLGQSALGIYQTAYKLSVLPLNEFIGIYNTVTFPVFSQSQSSFRLKRAAALSVIGLIVLLFLASLTLYFLASPLVFWVLGPGWEAAVDVVKILAFLGLIRGAANSFNSFFLAKGLQRYVTTITFFSALGLLLTIVPFVNRFGLEGAAYSALTGSLLALPLGLYFTYITLSRGFHDGF